MVVAMSMSSIFPEWLQTSGGPGSAKGLCTIETLVYLYNKLPLLCSNMCIYKNEHMVAAVPGARQVLSAGVVPEQVASCSGRASLWQLQYHGKVKQLKYGQRPAKFWLMQSSKLKPAGELRVQAPGGVIHAAWLYMGASLELVTKQEMSRQFVDWITWVQYVQGGCS